MHTIATRCPNVYGSLAVANMFVHNHPRHFAEIMANLLFWIGPDRIIWGTDFPIWYPHWLLDDFMAFQLPEDLKAEYGVDLTDEIKQKIIGGNIARLYGIDIESTSMRYRLKEPGEDPFSPDQPTVSIQICHQYWARNP
jgi:predicted TIM-barrel fold metal-dependent hydrolase